jgi:hypothetical protein
VHYSLQIKENTDVSNIVDLLAFIWCEVDGKINEDFLFRQSLPMHNTSEAIFNGLNDVTIGNKTGWLKCVTVSTDGAPAMSAKCNGRIITHI